MVFLIFVINFMIVYELLNLIFVVFLFKIVICKMFCLLGLVLKIEIFVDLYFVNCLF